MTRPARPSPLIGLALGACALAFVPSLARADYREAASEAQAALEAKDAARLQKAIKDLGKDGSQRAIKLLLQLAVHARTLDVKPALLEAIGSQTDEKMVSYLRRQALKHSDWTVRYLLVEALLLLPEEEGHKTLIEAFEDKEASVAGRAMHLAAEGQIVQAIPAMIARLEDLEKSRARDADRLREACLRGLEELTGESFPDLFGWQSWWKVHEGRFDPKAVDRKKKGSSETSTVLRKIEKRGDQGFLEKLEKGDIFCVTGDYDHVEQVLAALKLPHTVIQRGDLEKRIQEVQPTAVIIFNCAQQDPVLSPATVERLAALVKAGAYLFTSDWELQNVLMKTTPGSIGMGNTTGEHEFPIQISPDARSHPYMRDVFPDDPFQAAQMKWKIDGMSFCVKAGRSEAVFPLVTCQELQKQYGSDIVACTYRHGRGSVLHVLSHFDKQKDASGDGFALQQMLLNFIIEKQKFRKR